MLALIAVQVAFAAFAWTLAGLQVRRAGRVSLRAAMLVARSLRTLVRRGDRPAIARFALELGDDPLAPLVAMGARDDDLAEAERVDAAQELLEACRPRTLLLRGLATLGTTVGLLAAIVALRTGLSVGGGASVQASAGAALDSAVVGFVTALPCWTAIALSRTYASRAFEGIDAVLTALSLAVDDAPSTK